MSEQPAHDALNRYAPRRTTPEEERSLFHDATLDQDHFDALAQEAMLRALLDDPEARRILLKETAEPVWTAWLTRLLRQRQAWAITAVAALAIAIIAALTVSRPEPPTAVTANLSSAGSLTGVDRLPDDALSSVRSFLNSGQTSSGTHLTVTVSRARRLQVKASYRATANLLVVALPEGQGARILVPNVDSDPGPVKAGVTVSAPAAAGEGLDLDGVGHVTIALLVFAPDSDPMEAIRLGRRLPQPLAIASQEIM